MRAVVAWLVACAGPSLSGAVTDADGLPVAGAALTLSPSCAAVTTADGSFHLPCAAGTYDVTVSAPGFLDAVGTVVLDGPVVLGPTRLVALPDAAGSYVLDGHHFRPAAMSGVVRTLTNGATREKAFCVPSGAPANVTAAGPVSLFRRNQGAFRVFQLDDGGCARRAGWEAGEWKDRSPPPVTPWERRLSADASVSRVDLPPGRWFVAEWDQGWFVPEDDTEASFVGFVVETR